MQDNRKGPLTIRILTLSSLIAVAAGLSACGDSGGGGGSVQEPEPPKVGAARFGANFAVSFSAVPLSDPRDPAQGDIIALSLTTDPLEVP